MKFKTVTFFILNLLLSTFSLKIPNPSSTVLIVNHLNYLRYDYLSQPGRSHHHGYPFYHPTNTTTADNLNRTLNSYSSNRTTTTDHRSILNDLDIDFNNRLDEQLTNRIISNHLNYQQLNERNSQPDLNNNQVDHQIQLNELTNQFNEQIVIQNDQNALPLPVAAADEPSLILSSSLPQDQQRLNELNNLQQIEPSLSVVLDADSPFLNNNNNEQSLDVLKAEKTATTEENKTNNDTSILNEFLNFEDDFENNFNLLQYTNSDSDLSLALNPTVNSTYSLDSDLFLPANIDDLANDLIGISSVDFMEPNYVTNDHLIDDSNVLINSNPIETLNELQLDDDDKSIQSTLNNNNNNTTTSQLDSDINYIHELLSDEDLQLIGFPSENIVDDLNADLNNLELNNEVSSDSAVSMSHSDWFDSASSSDSSSSSHFEYSGRRHQAKDAEKKQRNGASSSFELDESDLGVFDQILNFEDNNQEVVLSGSTTNILQNVLHNHTYSNEDQEATSSTVARATSQFEDERSRSRLSSINFDMVSVTSETTSEEERTSLSRDERKAKDLQIPISVCEIINMPIDEFNECLTRYELNEQQLTLIRDIRRRGKNKVAAQNCRKRKINQIVGLQSEVDKLHDQKNNLFFDYEKLFAIREMAQNKYQKLYDFIAERSLTNAALLANFELIVKRNNSKEAGAVGGGGDHRPNATTPRYEDENQPNQLNQQLNEITSTNDFLKLKTIDIKKENNVQPYKKALAMN